MRRVSAVALALAIGLSGGTPARPQGKGKDIPTLQISWHGQSFFQIKSSKGTNIVIDPHAIEQYGRLLGVRADIVLATHFHNDHTQFGVIENLNEKTIKDKSVRLIMGLKGTPRTPEWNLFDEKVADIRIRTVGVYHDDMEGLKYGKNAVFCLEIDGWRIVHLGDLGHVLTPDQVRKIGPVDILMIPVGGIYTINGSEAKKVVDQLKPKEFIFPMHCGTKVYDDVLPPAEFIEEFRRENFTSSEDNRIVLSEGRKQEQRPRPMVVLLNFWPKGKKD
jgi:L-ascorbate metabolism protein UlaG (beta-lactamase superfamily)